MKKRIFGAVLAFLFVFICMAFASPPPNKNGPNSKEKVILIKEVAIPEPAAGAPTQTFSVNLSWTDTVNPTGTTYNVYKASGSCPGSGTPTGATKVNTSPVTVKTYVDSGLTTPGTLCYYVTAVGPGGESTASNTAAATIPSPPAAPTGLTVTVTSP